MNAGERNTYAPITAPQHPWSKNDGTERRNTRFNTDGRGPWSPLLLVDSPAGQASSRQQGAWPTLRTTQTRRPPRGHPAPLPRNTHSSRRHGARDLGWPRVNTNTRLGQFGRTEVTHVCSPATLDCSSKSVPGRNGVIPKHVESKQHTPTRKDIARQSAIPQVQDDEGATRQHLRMQRCSTQREIHSH